MYKYYTCLFINGQWKKVRPVIFTKNTIPPNAMLSNEGFAFLTNTGEFFIVNSPSTVSTFSMRAANSGDFSPIKYTAYLNAPPSIPKNSLIALSGEYLLTSNNEYFIVSE